MAKIDYDALIEQALRPDLLTLSQLEAQLGGEDSASIGDGFTLMRVRKGVEVYRGDGYSVKIWRRLGGVSTKYLQPGEVEI